MDTERKDPSKVIHDSPEAELPPSSPTATSMRNSLLLGSATSGRLSVLDAPQPKSITEYIKLRGGKNQISRVLIANNGIAAVKAIRSIRRWAYETFGNDRLVEFVVMATPQVISNILKVAN